GVKIGANLLAPATLTRRADFHRRITDEIERRQRVIPSLLNGGRFRFLHRTIVILRLGRGRGGDERATDQGKGRQGTYAHGKRFSLSQRLRKRGACESEVGKRSSGAASAPSEREAVPLRVRSPRRLARRSALPRMISRG